jgi:hypothetical protein
MKVHCLVNKTNGRIFVDENSHANEKECLAWHKKAAKQKIQHPLYADLIACGDDAFEALTLEGSLTAEQLDAARQRWILLLGTNISTLGYNVT